MNIYDIAKLANVSSATVSRVINNNPGVSKEKRDRVMEVLERHNYVPNMFARNLAGASTKTVAILTVDIRYINYSIITHDVEQQASSMGYNVILCNTTHDNARQQFYLRMLGSKKVDCLVLIGATLCNPVVHREIRNNYSEVPVIMMNSQFDGPNAYHVRGRVDEGMARTIDYLYSLGHRKIAYVKNEDHWVSNLKRDMFVEKTEQYGIIVGEHTVYGIHSGYESGVAAVDYFEEHGVEYTAITGCDDITATGIVKRLKAIGKSVPGDVSVVGYFNSVYAKICDPALTSVDNDMNGIADAICNILNRVLAKQTAPKKTYISPSLVVRDSAAPPR
jgi:DNA-binding LacI/PurR family transcriptional regulator